MHIQQKLIKILKHLEAQKLTEFLCEQILVCKSESHFYVPLPLCIAEMPREW